MYLLVLVFYMKFVESKGSFFKCMLDATEFANI